MNRLIRIELLKLHTIRATYGLAVAAAGITALFASLEASRAGLSGTTPISTVAGLSTVSTATGVAMVLAAVLGVIGSSGEYRHTTATLTYLATPSRSRVLAAKSAAAAIAGFAYGIVAALVATAAALIFVAAHHDHDTLGAGTFAAHILGAGLGAALLAAVGVAIGSLISPASSASSSGAWSSKRSSAAVSPRSVPTSPTPPPRPSAARKLGAAAFGPAYSVGGQQALPFIAAAALIAAMGALLALIAARTTVCHDIT